MRIEDIAKKYIRLECQKNKNTFELNEINTCKHILNLWSSMGNNDLKRLFQCIIEHRNPSAYNVKILENNVFNDELKRIVSNIFYAYLLSVKNEYTLDEKFILEWKNVYDSLYREEIDENIESDDYFLKEYIKSNKTLMYKYILDNHFSNKFLENKLIVLKGWRSATPIINSYFRSDYCNGGGFYININGTGIVIDPGCNFIKNMHEQGIRIFDIQYVIVTHNHIDHNASVMELQNLNYEYNNFIAKNSNNVLNHKKLPKNYPNKIMWIVDKETSISLKSNTDFSVPIKSYAGNNIIINEINVPNLETDIDEDKLNHLPSKKFVNDTAVANYEIEKTNGAIELTFFRTYHMKNSYGLCIKSEINQELISIGFTSDTGYFSKLPIHLCDCNIIIENISELIKEDLNANEIHNKANHLKLNGCIKTISKMKTPPKLAIISEFWGGKDDIRLFIIKRIKESIVKFSRMDEVTEIEPTQILAADIGLTIKLDNYTVRCSACGNEVPLKKITTVQNEKYGQLKYICHRCHV